MKKAPLLAIFILFLGPSLCLASDTRVDSMGGLTLVVTDEADDVNPFVLGNPAGLALLPTRSRLDAAGAWTKEYFPPSGDQFHLYGLVDELDNDSVKYHGLMVFPAPGFAVQADGDTLHTEGQNNFSNNVYTNDRTRELFRTALDFGPFTLGAEIQPSQSSLVFSPRQFDLVNRVISGTGNVNNLGGTAGLLINLAGAGHPDEPHLRIGGVFSTQLNPSQEVDDLPVSNTVTSNNFTITQTITDQNVIGWGPEIYFDTPDGIQAAALGRFSRFDVSFQQDSTNTGSIGDIANFKAESGNVAVGLGGFKASSPLGAGLRLKTGGSFSIEAADTSAFTPAGAANGGVSATSWTAQLGTGFEAPGDYTVGIQGSLRQVNGTGVDGSGVTNTSDFLDYKIQVGGEHWLSKAWAMRLGVVYEDGNNRGTAEQNTFYFPIDPGMEVATTTITAGLGYQDPHFKADLALSMGQPSVSDNPDAYGDIYSIQLNSSLLF